VAFSRYILPKKGSDLEGTAALLARLKEWPVVITLRNWNWGLVVRALRAVATRSTIFTLGRAVFCGDGCRHRRRMIQIMWNIDL